MSLIPEGTFKGQITGWAVKDSTKAKTPHVEFEVQLNPQSGLDAMVRTEVSVYVSQKALPMAVKTLGSLGFKDTNYRRLNPEAKDRFDFTGAPCDVRIEHETYDNGKGPKVRHKANFFVPNPPVSESRLEEIFENMGEQWVELVEAAA
jgi:hypothetical protein